MRNYTVAQSQRDWIVSEDRALLCSVCWSSCSCMLRLWDYYQQCHIRKQQFHGCQLGACFLHHLPALRSATFSALSILFSSSKSLARSSAVYSSTIPHPCFERLASWINFCLSSSTCVVPDLSVCFHVFGGSKEMQLEQEVCPRCRIMLGPNLRQLWHWTMLAPRCPCV